MPNGGIAFLAVNRKQTNKQTKNRYVLPVARYAYEWKKTKKQQFLAFFGSPALSKIWKLPTRTLRTTAGSAAQRNIYIPIQYILGIPAGPASSRN